MGWTVYNELFCVFLVCICGKEKVWSCVLVACGSPRDHAAQRLAWRQVDSRRPCDLLRHVQHFHPHLYVPLLHVCCHGTSICQVLGLEAANDQHANGPIHHDFRPLNPTHFRSRLRIPGDLRMGYCRSRCHVLHPILPILSPRISRGFKTKGTVIIFAEKSTVCSAT